MSKSPYTIIKKRLVTEKANVLMNLKNAESNVCLKKCESPKYIFVVDMKSNKAEIATALEQIYEDKKIKVTAVNTIITKPKTKRVRGYTGQTKSIKKAIVTLEKGDSIDE